MTRKSPLYPIGTDILYLSGSDDMSSCPGKLGRIVDVIYHISVYERKIDNKLEGISLVLETLGKPFYSYYDDNDKLVRQMQTTIPNDPWNDKLGSGIRLLSDVPRKELIERGHRHPGLHLTNYLYSNWEETHFVGGDLQSCAFHEILEDMKQSGATPEQLQAEWTRQLNYEE